MSTVAEVLALLEGKPHDHIVNFQVQITGINISTSEPVAEEKTEDVVTPSPEAENATESTTEAVAYAPVSE